MCCFVTIVLACSCSASLQVPMDICMDVDEFHHVSEVDHEGTASGFGGVEL